MMDQTEPKINLTATYNQDSKRYHRYLIDNNQYGIVGNIYIEKKSTIPKTISINLKVDSSTHLG